MNQKQRKQWDIMINAIPNEGVYKNEIDLGLLIATNAYILKLERELQNIKGGRKIAAILKSKVNL